MKKWMIAAWALFLLVALGACAGDNAVLPESKTYEIAGDIHSLDIQISAADFKIEHADAFSVESNLKYLSVSERNGVLTVAEKAKGNGSYHNAVLTLYLPAGQVFDSVDITTGAGRLTAAALSAGRLELRLGAGDARFQRLDASVKADIAGGAGKITVAGGTLRDLTLEMGMGELNLTAALRGNSDLEFGVGESNITLLGSKADYAVDIEKGIGSIRVDGKTVSDFGSGGNGQNYVEIEGGIGAVNITFREE